MLIERVGYQSTKKKTINPLALQHIDNIIKRQFSSGVRLQELISIGIILTSIIPPLHSPNRDEKRSYTALLTWFYNNWDMINPILPMIQLRDENNQIINSQREMFDMLSK